MHEPTNPRILNEPAAQYTQSYETDLFGNPLPEAQGRAQTARTDRARLRGNVQPATGLPVTRAGEYHVRTIVGTQAQRKLSASLINTPQEAAQSPCGRGEASYRNPMSHSCCSRSKSLACLTMARSLGLKRPLSALRADRALPWALRGPVDCAHGLQVLISAACRARRSGVQPLAMVLLQ